MWSLLIMSQDSLSQKVFAAVHILYPHLCEIQGRLASTSIAFKYSYAMFPIGYFSGILTNLLSYIIQLTISNIQILNIRGILYA